MSESPFTSDSAATRRSGRQHNGLTGGKLLVVLAALGLILVCDACSRRPPPIPPPAPSGSRSGGGRSSSDSADRTLTAPELSLRIEPSLIQPGDSALLTWESKNADRVTIEPSIGSVETSGRIKFYPDATTTYSVRAEGPGGEVTRSVTVDVRTGAPESNVDEEDLNSLSLADQFAATVKPIFFDFDSATLSEEAKLTLDGNLRWLERADHRSIHILLEGHCDERGSEEFNLALGDQRAEVVRDYLVAHGLDPQRVATVSLGEERPFDARHNEEGYALNRRTQFVLMGEP